MSNFYDRYADTIGMPGGPCHVIRNIEEENLPDKLKRELIEDIEKGKDLSNQKADMVYDRQNVPTKISEFPQITLTAHAIYRMNQRGVTIQNLQSALDEFSRWYKARNSQTRSLRPKELDIFQNLAQGNPTRFDAAKIGLTIVFVIDRKRARLVSAWWTNQRDPSRPRPGECRVSHDMGWLARRLRNRVASLLDLPEDFDRDAGRPPGSAPWGGVPNAKYDDVPVPRDNKQKNKEYRKQYHSDSRFREKKKRDERLRYRQFDVQQKKRRERYDNRAGSFTECFIRGMK